MPRKASSGLAVGVLDVDARITGPGCLEDPMAGAALTCGAKIGFADFFEIRETDVFGSSRMRAMIFSTAAIANGFTIGAKRQISCHG